MIAKIFGWIFNTLEYHVSNEEKEWRSKSDLRNEFAYGILRSFPIYLSRRPVKRTAFLVLFFSFVTIGINYFPPIQLFDVPNDYNHSNLLSYFSILWSGQATIAALIYPIVIAFVTLLLQRRHNAKSFLNIYLHDTAAIPSGLLAIGLLFLMTIQYFFLTQVEIIVGVYWLLIDAFFFSN